MGKKYHITLQDENDYWDKYIINKWIEINYKCPNCKLDTLTIIKGKTIATPFKLRCKKNCRKQVNLRRKIFFSFFPKLSPSIIIDIIKLFILDNKNAVEMGKSNARKKNNLNSINVKIIYKELLLIRKSITKYLKEIYFNPMAEKNKNEIVAIDESLFYHYKDK